MYITTLYNKIYKIKFKSLYTYTYIGLKDTKIFKENLNNKTL